MPGDTSFENSEIISLISAVPLYIVIIALHRRIIAQHTRVFLYAVTAALGAMLFTILEHIVWFNFFNTLEHLCYGITGIFLAVGCVRLKSTHKHQHP